MSQDADTGVAIMGATATGKTSTAIRLAERIEGEIISMDSRQVYQLLDVGTAKPRADERERVVHHMVDVLDPSATTNAGWHVKRAVEIAREVRSRGKVPIFVGGTALYFRVLFNGLIDVLLSDEVREMWRTRFERISTPELYEQLREVDPERAAALSATDRLRIARALEIYLGTGKTQSEHMRSQSREPLWPCRQFVVHLPRELLRQRIAQRTAEMLECGWGAEVEGLLARGYGTDTPAMRSLGYAILATALMTGQGVETVADQLVTVTQQYAKRQVTFFRGFEEAERIDVSTQDPVPLIERRLRAAGLL